MNSLLSINLSELYNTLQSLKQANASNYTPNEYDAAQDKFILHVEPVNDELIVSAFGTNHNSVRLQNAYNVPYEVRNLIFSRGASVTINGNTIPIKGDLTPGDGVYIVMAVPGPTAFPAISKCVVKIVNEDEALKLLKADVAKRHIDDNLTQPIFSALESTIHSAEKINFVVGTEDYEKDCKVATVFSCQQLTDHVPTEFIVATGYEGGQDRTKVLAHITVAHVVVKPSGESTLVMIYPGGHNTFCKTMLVNGKSSLYQVEDPFQVSIGKPEYCV